MGSGKSWSCTTAQLIDHKTFAIPHFLFKKVAILHERLQVDPVKGNVTFSAATYGWSFTLRSFAQLYADIWGVPLDPK